MAEQPEAILWADVGDRLGIGVATLRELRASFGDALGLPGGRTVREDVVPALAKILILRERGEGDEEIQRRLRDDPALGDVSPRADWPEVILDRMGDSGTESEGHELPEELPADRSPRWELYRTGSEDEEEKGDYWMIHRLLSTEARKDREILYMVLESIQRLTLEVRDLRYALLISTSRKDRKKGIKSVSRLLSG